MISENTVFDLEGRCSIHLSYGRSQRDISRWLASAQARLSGGGMECPVGVVERIAQFGRAQLGCLTKQAAFAGCNV